MYKMAMLLGLLVAIMNVSAFGVGFIGTPTAELDQGEWNFGLSYTYSDMDLEKAKMKGGGETFKLKIDDVKTQRYYATIGCGLTDSWEAYLQLGAADLKAKVRGDDPDDTWVGFNFDNDFAWGWGTRYTFSNQGNVRWGASLQMNWLDTSSGRKTEGSKANYETFDLIIAVGPTVDMGGWKLYGGPFYYMLDGDLDIKGVDPKVSGDLEEDSNFGGFIGAQIGMAQNSDFTTELSFTGDGYSIGAGVSWAF